MIWNRRCDIVNNRDKLIKKDEIFQKSKIKKWISKKVEKDTYGFWMFIFGKDDWRNEFGEESFPNGVNIICWSILGMLKENGSDVDVSVGGVVFGVVGVSTLCGTTGVWCEGSTCSGCFGGVLHSCCSCGAYWKHPRPAMARLNEDINKTKSDREFMWRKRMQVLYEKMWILKNYEL